MSADAQLMLGPMPLVGLYGPDAATDALGPVSCAVSASTVSAHVRDEATGAIWPRRECVELARLCSGEPWATRVMLRLWREVCAPQWPHWPVKHLIAYSQNDRHEGRIYRFDGWRKFTESGGSSGGGTWSTKRTASHAASGSKTGWVCDLESPQ